MPSRLELMRRSIATGLLCLFNTLWIAPLVSSDPHSNLPACCRRDGKHHCSMMQMTEQSAGGPNSRAVTPKCPLFPKTVPLAHRIQLYALATRSLLGSIVDQPAAPAQAEIQYRVSSARAHQERGPPQFDSLS